MPNVSTSLPPNRLSSRWFITAVIGILTLLIGCSEQPSNNKGSANTASHGGPPNMPPPEVPVLKISPQKLSLISLLPGRLQATRTAEIRARVEGILQKRVFREGSDVHAGDPLFILDKIPFEAAYASAKATLAKAEANLIPARQKAERYEQLLASQAVTQQAYDEAKALFQQAEAEIIAAKAALTQAQLNLGYTTATAPIAGRIGRALVSEGTLVGKGTATHLATIEQIDPIYVNFTQPSLQALKLKQALAKKDKNGSDTSESVVRLYLEDGSLYPVTGRLLFSDLAVDPGTGEINLRAEFPNPKRELLPGMYVRIEVPQGVLEQAITVPQKALMRSAQGASVLIVNAENQVVVQPVQTGEARGDQWLITSGLQGGEQLIIDGLLKIKPGMTVKPTLWSPTPIEKPAHAASTPSPTQKAN